MNWIDKAGYPWHLNVAQQLHINLVKSKPSNEMAIHIAETAGINVSYIPLGQAIFFLWKDILDYASSDGQLRDLLNGVVKQLNPKHPMMGFFREILHSGDGPVDAEPLNEDGTPKFISDNDLITEDESLLFKEDLTLPIGRLRLLIKTLEKLDTLAASVCRMIIDIHGATQYGTGFRIGAKTLLTNHHVVHSKNTGDQATAVTAQFGYDDDGAGGLLNAIPFKCNAGSIQSDKDNDWAIIISLTDLPDSIPIINLTETIAPKIHDQAFIIQHPLSGTKRVGYVRNTVSNVTDRVVHYLTDTQEGSSGAPVFNEDGKLIAIHHAGGLPVQLTGKMPMKKNEGIRISKILENFIARNIEVV